MSKSIKSEDVRDAALKAGFSGQQTSEAVKLWREQPMLTLEEIIAKVKAKPI
jgi:hypothetical protein